MNLEIKNKFYNKLLNMLSESDYEKKNNYIYSIRLKFNLFIKRWKITPHQIPKPIVSVMY